MKEARNTEEGREVQRREVEGKKPSLNVGCYCFNPFASTRHYRRHQNKVRVKGLRRKSSYLAAFFYFFFFHGSARKLNPLARKNYFLKFFSLA